MLFDIILLYHSYKAYQICISNSYIVFKLCLYILHNRFLFKSICFQIKFNFKILRFGTIKSFLDVLQGKIELQNGISDKVLNTSVCQNKSVHTLPLCKVIN